MTARSGKPSRQQIATKRLILRPIRQSDNADVLRILANRAVSQYTALSKQQRVMIEHMQRRILPGYPHHGRRERLQWAMTLRDDDTLIGRCGFEDIFPQAGYAELGYWLAQEHWGQGLMSEAVAATVTYGFHTLGFSRIQAWVLEHNVASIRVLKKCGFHYRAIDDISPELLPFSIMRAEYELQYPFMYP